METLKLKEIEQISVLPHLLLPNLKGLYMSFFASKVKRVILFLIFTIIPSNFQGLIFNFQNFQS